MLFNSSFKVFSQLPKVHKQCLGVYQAVGVKYINPHVNPDYRSKFRTATVAAVWEAPISIAVIPAGNLRWCCPHHQTLILPLANFTHAFGLRTCLKNFEDVLPDGPTTWCGHFVTPIPGPWREKLSTSSIGRRKLGLRPSGAPREAEYPTKWRPPGVRAHLRQDSI